jgi:hypothetical protein
MAGWSAASGEPLPGIRQVRQGGGCTLAVSDGAPQRETDG